MGTAHEGALAALDPLTRTTRFATACLYRQINAEPRWRGVCTSCERFTMEIWVGDDNTPVRMMCMNCEHAPNWRKLEHELFIPIWDVDNPLLYPDLPAPDAPERVAAEVAWAKQLAKAVKAGELGRRQARAALEREVELSKSCRR